MSKFLRRSLMIFIIKGFRTIFFISIVISTTFRPICPSAFFRCLSNSGTFTELRTTSFIKSTEVACSDSVCHIWVQVSSIPVLLLACCQDWTCSLQMFVFFWNFREPAPITVTLCVLLDNSEWILGTYKLDVLTWLGLLLLCMIFYLWTYRPKHCGNNNKDEDNSQKTLNDKNHQASYQRFWQLISSRYRPDTIYDWKQLEKLNKKLARMTNHLTFQCRCWDLKLLPPNLTIKIPVHSKRARKVTKRLEQELVRDWIRNNRWKKYQHLLGISSKLTPFLGRISMIDDRTRIQ